MGHGKFTSMDWSKYTSSRGFTASSTASDMYKSKVVDKRLEPYGVKYRESCDSPEHPNSTPIILGLDVTGSMGSVLEVVAKKLNTLILEIYDREPVTDPQVMVMAFGDVECDSHPLQVTQFESDIRVAEQLGLVYFERGGGGNGGESYTLPWYFASRHTKTDCYEKHGKKGFLFTIGDEPYLDILYPDAIQKFVGDSVERALSADELLSEVSRMYEVYHLVVKPIGIAPTQWANLLGDRAISVQDVSKIPEIIVSILEVSSGKDVKDVIASWDGSTAMVVKEAIKDLKTVNSSADLIEF